MAVRTSPTLITRAKRVQLAEAVVAQFRAELIEALKPELRQWMAEVNADDSNVLGLSETQMNYRIPSLRHSFLDLEVMIAGAKALVKDGEWLELHQPTHHHIWASNPTYIESYAS